MWECCGGGGEGWKIGERCHGLWTGIIEAGTIMLINFAPTLPDLQIQALEKLYLSLNLTSLLSKNPEENILCAYCASWVATEYQSITLDVIPNMVIEAYCNKGDFNNVAAYVDQVIPNRKQYLTSTWVCFVIAYVRKNDMEKAVEIMKKCVVAEDKRGCRLNNDTFEAFVKYLKENGDLQME
uniref:Pentatricopeptide repeat-containing protein n=1 Tax=Tanacetum cinerariifolium TaxID=118510 RepID=A0A6L2KQA7_TANCI|nr:hypothetical protein [Tanacetum cinerariifolium]